MSLTGYRTLATAIALIATIVYAGFVVDGFGPRFFGPDCSHNDLLQQGFQFYRINDPQIFADDLVYESMRAYLPPFHFGLGLLLTWPSDNPVLTGHILMSLQVGVLCLALFLLVRRLTGSSVAGTFAVAWLLHSRSLLHLMAGGLPRGWIGPVLACYLLSIALSGADTRKRWLPWLVILLAAGLNPVACLICLVTHGLFLLITGFREVTAGRRVLGESVAGESSPPGLWVRSWQFTRRQLLPFAVFGGGVCLFVSISTARSADIGEMASLAEASRLQAFSRIGGRFPILPLSSPWQEFLSIGLQPVFGMEWYRVSRAVKDLAPFVGWFVIALLGFGMWRARRNPPYELYCFGAAILFGYTLARLVAFKLYIPDRYFGMPLALFIIATVVVLVWRGVGSLQPGMKSLAKAGFILVTGGVLFLMSGTGIRGPEFFDTCRGQQAALWSFLQNNTAPTALIAGHPTSIDGVQLFGKRKGFITTETAHPFYDAYYQEVKRRIELTFRAKYASSWREFYEILAPEGIDYFVFRARDIQPEAYQRATYEIPWLRMVRRLTARPFEEYAFASLADPNQQPPFVVLRTEGEVVVDVVRLKKFLEAT